MDIFLQEKRKNYMEINRRSDMLPDRRRKNIKKKSLINLINMMFIFDGKNKLFHIAEELILFKKTK